MSLERSTGTTMRAAALDRFGGVDTIQMQNLPVPEPGPDEVLLRVESAGVGVWDPFEREGEFAKMFGTKPRFPYVLGSDGAGTVAAVGEKVRGLKEGDRAYALALVNPKGGFYAEYAVVKAQYVSPIPKKLTVEQAGAMPSDALTALHGLDDILQLKSGESLLVFGAGGGIGHLALQLAKRMGARVFAVASGDDGVALAKKLGADTVVNGREDDVEAAARAFAPGGLDAALVTAGGETADRVLQTMRKNGRVAYPNGVTPPPKAPPGVKIQNYDLEPTASQIEKLNRLIESGPFEVHVARTFPLDKAADAHRELDQHFLGKLALRPQ
jgi:NADPH:quinone reductase-like Zn-dependent oxidoreductase